MKKIVALLTLGFALYSPTNVLLAYDFYDEMATIILADEDDDNDFFSIDTDLNNLSLDNITTTRQTRSISDNAELIYTLFAAVLADNPTAQNNLLNLPIYQQTSSIRNRPILEYPFTLTYAFDMRAYNDISLSFFLNKWSHKNFTKSSQDLGSYFLLGNPQRLAVLQMIDDMAGDQVVDDLGKSLALFDPAIIQENRIGGIVQAHVVHNRFFLCMQLPILYTERNLYITPSQKAAVEASALGRMLRTDGVSENDFIYDHIVMDQFGCGDLKFKCMYEMHRSQAFDIDLGGFVILPTATAVKQGMIGVWFDPNNERAYLDLATIDPNDITAENQEDVANFFLSAVDKLSSNLLNCPLGNNGHVVIAPSVNFDWYFAQDWQFSNDISAQIPLPAREQRFYQRTQTMDQFLSDYNKAFDQGAENPIIFVNFINEELQNLFFPYVFSTMVYPGTVFNITNQVLYNYHDWDFYIGANFWYQTAEKLQPFLNAYNNSQNYSYDYAGAAAASAGQEKLFAKASWNGESTNYSWSLSLYGDITIWNSGIGNDFTLGINIDGKF